MYFKPKNTSTVSAFRKWVLSASRDFWDTSWQSPVPWLCVWGRRKKLFDTKHQLQRRLTRATKDEFILQLNLLNKTSVLHRTRSLSNEKKRHPWHLFRNTNTNVGGLKSQSRHKYMKWMCEGRELLLLGSEWAEPVACCCTHLRHLAWLWIHLPVY